MEQLNLTYTIRSVITIIMIVLWVFADLSVALAGTAAVMALLFPIPVTLVGYAAIGLLSLTALSQLWERTAVYSESLAIYMFYSLCLLVLIQFRSMREDGVVASLVIDDFTLDLRQQFDSAMSWVHPHEAASTATVRPPQPTVTTSSQKAKPALSSKQQPIIHMDIRPK